MEGHFCQCDFFVLYVSIVIESFSLFCKLLMTYLVRPFGCYQNVKKLSLSLLRIFVEMGFHRLGTLMEHVDFGGDVDFFFFLNS